MWEVFNTSGFEIIEEFFLERCKQQGLMLDDVCLDAGISRKELWRFKKKVHDPTWPTLRKIHKFLKENFELN